MISLKMKVKNQCGNDYLTNTLKKDTGIVNFTVDPYYISAECGSAVLVIMQKYALSESL